jgi:anti-anti-sigma factor
MTPIESVPVTVTRRPLNPSSRRGPPCTVIWLRGEHDMSTVAELSERIARAIAMDDADLVVDLADVEYMGAATVGVLSRARELLRARSRSLVLRSPSRCARRVLELCGHADPLDRRSANDRPLTGDALRTWVAVPATVSSVHVDRPADARTTVIASLGTP